MDITTNRRRRPLSAPVFKGKSIYYNNSRIGKRLRTTSAIDERGIEEIALKYTFSLVKEI